ncbi:molybdopterin cofactor-binding domain-containing protein [Escherichia coli]
MEPHASMAVWDGNQLILWTSNQMIDWCRTDLAKTLKVPVENVRIISPYIGGGFGGKLFLRSDALLAALAARAVKRPVKVMLPAPLFPITPRTAPPPFSTCVSVPTRAGKSPLSHMKAGLETCPAARRKRRYSKANYSTPGRIVIPACGLATLDLPEGNAMRAPGEAPGLMALEIAIDELAEKAGINPVEFRSSMTLRLTPPTRRAASLAVAFIECLRTGADKFGWKQRNATAGQVRDGEWLVGHGVAAGFRNNLLEKSGARVHLEQNDAYRKRT